MLAHTQTHTQTPTPHQDRVPLMSTAQKRAGLFWSLRRGKTQVMKRPQGGGRGAGERARSKWAIFQHGASASPGFIHLVLQNVTVTTPGLQIHERCAIQVAISIKRTHLRTLESKPAEYWWKKVQQKLGAALFRLLLLPIRDCHKCWCGWTVDTHTVTSLT